MVTGAVHPLAAALADQLAASGADLVLVAREHERLAMLAESLQQRYDTSVMVLAAELSQPGTPRMLFDTVQPQRPVDMLIQHPDDVPADNDASSTEEARSHAIVQRRVVALCELTQRFAAGIDDQGWGRVLFISTPSHHRDAAHTDAVTAASEAFVQQYARSLHRRWRGSGLACTLMTSAAPRSGQDAGAPRQQAATPSAQSDAATTRLARRALQALLHGAERVPSRRLRWL
ncbi:SDR family NAD(P)-dependent oxidoreductase [Algiphilus sp.]|uniref:SDR family NAD(P)-dependent oxidoreductase n=1 Tax=Algiphilus sp. TaxID=1872431 RepID=UPI003B52BAB1